MSFRPSCERRFVGAATRSCAGLTQRSRNLCHDSSPPAGSTDALHSDEGFTGFLGNKSVLFFDHAARRGITVEPTKDFAWNSAIRALGSVFVEHIKENESFSRCGLSCHSLSRIGC